MKIVFRYRFPVINRNTNHSNNAFVFTNDRTTLSSRRQQQQHRHGGQRVLHQCDDRKPLATRHAFVGERLPWRPVQQDRRAVHR